MVPVTAANEPGEDKMEALPEERHAPIMEVVRGAMLDVKEDRLTVKHLECRDAALHALDRAGVALEALAKVEAGSSPSKHSPRHLGVRNIQREHEALRDKLDRVYV